MRTLKLIPISAIATLLFAAGLTAKHAHAEDSAEPPPVSNPEHARMLGEVRGIFAHHCYKCHASDKQKGDLRLDTKEGVLAGGEGGAIVDSSKPDESELMRRLLLPAEDDDAMPPEGERLDKAQTDLLRAWIAEGAPWPDEQSGTFRRAPLALTKPPMPEASEGTHPVDAFVTAYFDEAGEKWPKSVDDATFLRRVYLDVIGVLPKYRDVAAFTRKKDKDKRSQVVKELLARNEDYALHWMTFWNDALRNDFAGIGYIDGGRKQISNWLYLALAQNKPYDVFVRELISPVDGSGGFINGIKWRGAVNASQITEMQAAQSLSQVFLGLNLKCASCHDSFINDWKLADSYALANVFAENPLEIHRCDQATGKFAETRFLFPELGTIDGEASRANRMKQVSEIVTNPANGRLPRTIVNRLWAKFLGRGLVEPVDEMDGLPWNQALLDWLAADLAENGYNLRHAMERILTSRAYSLKSIAIENPNTLTVGEFSFRGPVRKRLTAEQFADAVSQLVHPLFDQAAFTPPVADTVEIPELSESIGRAKWLWAPADGEAGEAEPGTVYFSKKVNPSYARVLTKGEAFLTADNSFELFVNGKKVGSGADHTKLHYVDFSKELKGRSTLIEVRATNGGKAKNPAGLFGIIVVSYNNQEGKYERLLVPTYEAWKVASTEDGEAVRSQEVPNKAWGEIGETVAMDTGFPGEFVRAAAVKNNSFLRALGRPVRDTISTGRISQATLLEALELTNGEFFNAKLKAGAETMVEKQRGRTSLIVRRAYREFLGRQPSEQEVKAVSKSLGEKTTTPEALQDFLWSLLMSPEFQIIY